MRWDKLEDLHDFLQGSDGAELVLETPVSWGVGHWLGTPAYTGVVWE